MCIVDMTAQISIVARRRSGASLAPVMATIAQDVDRSVHKSPLT
jgi:hypothetical protein